MLSLANGVKLPFLETYALGGGEGDKFLFPQVNSIEAGMTIYKYKRVRLEGSRTEPNHTDGALQDHYTIQNRTTSNYPYIYPTAPLYPR